MQKGIRVRNLIDGFFHWRFILLLLLRVPLIRYGGMINFRIPISALGIPIPILRIPLCESLSKWILDLNISIARYFPIAHKPLILDLFRES